MCGLSMCDFALFELSLCRVICSSVNHGEGVCHFLCKDLSRLRGHWVEWVTLPGRERSLLRLASKRAFGLVQQTTEKHLGHRKVVAHKVKAQRHRCDLHDNTLGRGATKAKWLLVPRARAWASLLCQRLAFMRVPHSFLVMRLTLAVTLVRS